MLKAHAFGNPQPSASAIRHAARDENRVLRKLVKMVCALAKELLHWHLRDIRTTGPGPLSKRGSLHQ